MTRFLIRLIVLHTLTGASCARSASGAEIPIEGFSQPQRTAAVAAAGSGIVRVIQVAEGATVEAGQVLVELDGKVHHALLEIASAEKEATGELEAAEAELSLKVKRLHIVRRLATDGNASNEELLRAEMEHDVATANHHRAGERRRQRELEYRKLLVQAETLVVQAPFPGVVVEIQKELGEFVSPVDPVVCTLVQLNVLSVEFLVPQTQLGALAVGNEVRVLFVESMHEAPGQVAFVAPFPNAETGAYLVKVRVENSQGVLSAGKRCRLLVK